MRINIFIQQKGKLLCFFFEYRGNSFAFKRHSKAKFFCLHSASTGFKQISLFPFAKYQDWHSTTQKVELLTFSREISKNLVCILLKNWIPLIFPIKSHLSDSFYFILCLRHSIRSAYVGFRNFSNIENTLTYFLFLKNKFAFYIYLLLVSLQME